MIDSTTETCGVVWPEKFGSGNDANARQGFPYMGVFRQTGALTGNKTVLFSSLGKCAKISQPATCPGIRCSPGCPGGRKIKGVFQKGKTSLLFPGKTGFCHTGEYSVVLKGIPGQGQGIFQGDLSTEIFVTLPNEQDVFPVRYCNGPDFFYSAKNSGKILKIKKTRS